MIDIRQSQNYANYLKRLGWIVVRKENVNYFIKKLPFVGSILKIQRPERINYQYIDVLVVEYGVFQIIIEPKNEQEADYLSFLGYKLSKSSYLPSKTLHINLTTPINRLIDSMEKDARRAIRKSGPDRGTGKKLVFAISAGKQKGEGYSIKSYSTPDEIKIWRLGWKQNVNFKKYVPGESQLINLRKCFPQNDSLFLASHNIVGRIIGGALFTISRETNDTVCYYWQGFSGPEGRSTLSQYSLLYQGILWAKKQGCRVFDFEGIYDPRFPNKSWLGFTHFKKSFGGHEVSYPGAFVKTRLPFLGTL
jgi:hypothetical protein